MEGVDIYDNISQQLIYVSSICVANESTYNDKFAPIGLQYYGFLKHRQLDCFLTACSS